MEVPAGTYRVTALRSGVIVDADGVEHEAAIESNWSEPITVQATEAEPVVASPRIVVTLWSAEKPDRSGGRVEAIFFQPHEGPARFWWATIREESP